MFKKALCLLVLTFPFFLTSCSDDNAVKDSPSGRISSFTAGVGNKSSSSSDVSSSTAGQVNAQVNQEMSNLSNKKLGWGHGHKKDKDNRPSDCDLFNEKYGKYGAVFIGGKESKKIYLTFDEGYENGYTAAILDTLKEKKASAVFFVTMDYIKANPELIERMIKEGHILGNHSLRHKSMPELSISEASNEILKVHDYIKDKYGYEMTLFRPPMGEYSERTLALTKSLGYKTVFWSFAYEDWKTDAQPDEGYAINKTTESLHPGAIYLLHAVSKTNAAILGEFIDKARQKGYEISRFDL